ncbi:MAG: hypothetical protein M3N47_01175 [Chloroflexota bacterium]|nr:hypothetical protein [Chloroflexota bacterium]
MYSGFALAVGVQVAHRHILYAAGAVLYASVLWTVVFGGLFFLGLGVVTVVASGLGVALGRRLEHQVL